MACLWWSQPSSGQNQSRNWGRVGWGYSGVGWGKVQVEMTQVRAEDTVGLCMYQSKT